MSLRSGRNTFLSDASALDTKDYIDRLFYLNNKASTFEGLDSHLKFDPCFAAKESKEINRIIAQKIRERKALEAEALARRINQ